MRRFCSICFKCLLCGLIFFALDRFCHRQTGGFALTKIHSNHPFNPLWEASPSSLSEQEEIDRALNQPYHFFSYGGESYVFLSEDGKTVLKFFKHHHMRPLPGLTYFSPHFLQNYLPDLWKRQEKRSLFLTSCTIAYQALKERTGLLMIHLNPTTHLKKTVTLIDKLHIAHTVDLDHVDFALQQRAELSYAHFRRLKKEGDLAAAQESLGSLLELIEQRCLKGIYDRDPNIRRNCGFLGNTAIELDLGSYSDAPQLKDPKILRETVQAHTKKFKRWIAFAYPELLPYFEMKLHAILLRNAPPEGRHGTTDPN